VIYEMAAGVQAFEGSTPAAVLAAILIRPPAPLVARNGSIPPRLEEIIAKALEKDRELRYQHAADLQADLKRLRRDFESNPSLSLATLVVAPPAATAVPAPATAAPAPATAAQTPATGAQAPAAAVQAATAAPVATTTAVSAPPAAATWRYAAGAAVVAVAAFGLAWVWRSGPAAPAPSIPIAAPAASTAAAPPLPSPAPGIPAAAPVSAPPSSPSPAVEARAPVQSPALQSAAMRTAPAPDPRPAPPSPAGEAPADPAPATVAATAPAPSLPAPHSGAVLSGVPVAPGALPSPPGSLGRATSPPAPPPALAESDEAAIRRAIATYATAVEKKDVALFRSVRPGLSAAEEARLRDSFRQIESQQVTIDIENIQVDGRNATVRVSRQDDLVVGGRRQTQKGRQVVRLEKVAAGWIIAEFR
jgi:hypothetical protein